MKSKSRGQARRKTPGQLRARVAELEAVAAANRRATAQRRIAPAVDVAMPADKTLMIRVTQQVMAALEQLRDTGLFGNGHDVGSVADELLNRAVREQVLEGWCRR